jgi:hypothetical protein
MSGTSTDSENGDSSGEDNLRASDASEVDELEALNALAVDRNEQGSDDEGLLSDGDDEIMMDPFVLLS